MANVTDIFWNEKYCFVQITRRLLQLGASVIAVDAEGLTPALACAPNPAVAKCLATILAAQGNISFYPCSEKNMFMYNI